MDWSIKCTAQSQFLNEFRQVSDWSIAGERWHFARANPFGKMSQAGACSLHQIVASNAGSFPGIDSTSMPPANAVSISTARPYENDPNLVFR